MNNPRRKELQKALDLLAEARSIIETCMEEEEEYRDNMPENLQESDRYYKADEACDAMSSALDSLDEVEENINTATE